MFELEKGIEKPFVFYGKQITYLVKSTEKRIYCIERAQDSHSGEFLTKNFNLTSITDPNKHIKKDIPLGKQYVISSSLDYSFFYVHPKNNEILAIKDNGDIITLVKIPEESKIKKIFDHPKGVLSITEDFKIYLNDQELKNSFENNPIIESDRRLTYFNHIDDTEDQIVPFKDGILYKKREHNKEKGSTCCLYTINKDQITKESFNYKLRLIELIDGSILLCDNEGKLVRYIHEKQENIDSFNEKLKPTSSEIYFLSISNDKNFLTFKTLRPNGTMFTILDLEKKEILNLFYNPNYIIDIERHTIKPDQIKGIWVLKEKEDSTVCYYYDNNVYIEPTQIYYKKGYLFCNLTKEGLYLFKEKNRNHSGNMHVDIIRIRPDKTSQNLYSGILRPIDSSWDNGVSRYIKPHPQGLVVFSETEAIFLK